MAFIEKPKYWIEEAAEILTTETGIKHSKQNIFEIAKTGKILICFYKPDLLYVQTDLEGYEHKRVYCECLKENILIPERGGQLSDVRFLVKASADVFYPILKDRNIKEIADFRPDAFKEQAFDLSAVNNNGELIKVARAWQHFGPLTGKEYECFSAWMKSWGIKTYDMEEEETALMDTHFLNGGNLYYSMGDFEGLVIDISIDDLCVPHWVLKQYINLVTDKPGILQEAPQGKVKSVEILLTSEPLADIIQAMKSTSSDKVRLFLKVAQNKKNEHGYYPFSKDLEAMSDNHYGYTDKKSFFRAFGRYFKDK